MGLLGLFFLGIPVSVLVMYVLLRVREHDDETRID